MNELQTLATEFAYWIKRTPGPGGAPSPGATVVFPHAGATAASYRRLAAALAAGGETFIVQYPQRAERLGEAAPDTLHDLADGLFRAGPWHQVGPLRLFGHSMGAVVAFEFARIAEQRGVPVHKLWVSAGPVPSTVHADLPLVDAELLADLTDLGGTDPRLLADDEFTRLLTTAARCDYRMLNRYHCEATVRIRADIHAVVGRHDHRVEAGSLRRWADHTDGAFTLSFFDGGHFYVNDHVDALANRVLSDG